MRRADWLVAFSHEHQHTLAAALRLDRAAANDAADVEPASVAFLADAAGEIAAHMHREETRLLPLAARLGALAPEEAEQVAREHLAIRTLLMRLTADPADREVAGELAATLREHVRWEERTLFAALQERIHEESPHAPDAPPTSAAHLAAHAGAAQESAVHTHSFASLTATSGSLAPRCGIAMITERDTAIIGAQGSGMLVVDDRADEGEALTYTAELAPGTTAIVAAGMRARIVAGADGLVWSAIEQRQGASVLRGRD